MHELTGTWAMTEAMRPLVARVAVRWLAGEPKDDDWAGRRPNGETQALHGARRVGSVKGDVAVIPVQGLIFARGNVFTDLFGMTSLESLGHSLQELAANDAIGAIVLDMDTPGGTTAGATEFAGIVRDVRAKKPIIAVANHLMASAGYWIAAGATEIVASPSASVGSIGVFGVHDDISKALESEGVTRTIISAGEHKIEGNELGPLDDTARAAFQAYVDSAYTQFVGDVAAGRGVAASAVRGGFGQGRLLDASDAKDAGMVDTVATLDETIARLTGKSRNSRQAAAGRRSRSVARAFVGAS